MFTDDDSKQLEEILKDFRFSPEAVGNSCRRILPALLARLEAAEKVISDAVEMRNKSWTDDSTGPVNVPWGLMNQMSISLEAWRKAAGKL